MTPDIKTIFFDVGNTLRIVLKEQDFIDQAEAGRTADGAHPHHRDP